LDAWTPGRLDAWTPGRLDAQAASPAGRLRARADDRRPHRPAVVDSSGAGRCAWTPPTAGRKSPCHLHTFTIPAEQGRVAVLRWAEPEHLLRWTAPVPLAGRGRRVPNRTLAVDFRPPLRCCA